MTSKKKESLPKRDFICLIQDAFGLFARRSAAVVGSAWSFVVAVLIICIWGASGPIFHFSDTWQLIINTGTTIVTFLMVFLIQNSQNRDTKAIQLKLDEIIRAVEPARNELIDLEELSTDELQALEKQFKALSKRTARSETFESVP